MKKWLSLLVTMCLLCSFVFVPAQVSASQTQSDAALAQMDAIEAVNAAWDQADPQTQVGLLIVASANRRIESIVLESCRMAERTDDEAEIYAIIVSMCVRTQLVSKTAQVAAELCGVHTVCDYVAVKIGNHTVMVDPLRVVLV